MYPVVDVAHIVLLDGPERLALHRVEDARVFVSDHPPIRSVTVANSHRK